jgi:hypothetical protein
LALGAGFVAVGVRETAPRVVNDGLMSEDVK